MKKAGILGGTFNPIHNMHLQMAGAAYKQFNLDEIWFMPNHHPAYKDEREIISGEHRKRMILHAIEPYPAFVFSDMELMREGVTYTRDTLVECKKAYPDTEFYFIIGEDSLDAFGSWYHPEEVAAMCKILVCKRGVTNSAFKEQCKKMSRMYHGSFLPFSITPSDISSVSIRQQYRAKKKPIGQVPDCVMNYIKIHGLYGTKEMAWKTPKSKRRMLAMLQATLRPKRYIHTLSVASTAACLAMAHGEDVNRAELAGLLHDCGKYYTDEEMIYLCHKYKIELSEVEQKNPALIHSKLGAYLAKHRYGIQDDGVLSAIAYHTTGKAAMTTLEKIVFVADYIEPNRSMNCEPYSLSELRKISFECLDEAVFMIAKNTTTYIENAKLPMDYHSLETLDYYRKEKE